MILVEVIAFSLLVLPQTVVFAQDPGIETPTDARIEVQIDHICFRSQVTPDGIQYNWSALGEMRGNVDFGGFTIASAHANGSVTVDPWWYGVERTGLVGGPLHINIEGRSLHDWSSWALRVLFVGESVSDDVISMTLWVRGFADLNATVWNQASRTVYTKEGGFVCDESMAAMAVPVIAALVIIVAVGGSYSIYRRSKRSRSSQGTRTDGITPPN